MEIKEKLLLLGFGDIAQRLTKIASEKYSVTGVRRSPSDYPGVQMIAADVTNKSQLQVAFGNRQDVIVITMTPSSMTDAGYQQAYVETVKTLLSALGEVDWQPRLIVFVSSTSVYGQSEADWVDESSFTEPTGFSGRRLLEAEQLLLESGLPVCIVRFSGIYGPGRERLINQVRSGQGAPAEPVIYSNRIHADDAAGVLEFLIEKQKREAIDQLYVATDCEPVPLHEVKAWLADCLSVPRDSLKPQPVNRQLRSNKRVSNQRLLKAGYRFSYPSYCEGYGALLKEH